MVSSSERVNRRHRISLSLLGLLIPFSVALFALAIGQGDSLDAVPYFVPNNGGRRLPPCDHPVYCKGAVLHGVQLAGVFNDSKTFVDMPLLADPDDIVKAWNALPASPPPSAIADFVQKHFAPAGSDVIDWVPTDWTPRPAFLANVSDPELKELASELNGLWKVLGKRISSEVGTHPQRHSLMAAEYPFIVPGGRFREFYYWDAYWILEGLLICNMTSTARGMISNFLDLVRAYGHVPNGNRVYYTDRSQPPLLTQMVEMYLRYVDDEALLDAALPVLDSEYDFWMQERGGVLHTPRGRYVLNHYYAETDEPRPESYAEDVGDAAGMTPEEAAEFFTQVATGAETGWDFSSRWMPDRKTYARIDPSALLPVDLNAVMLRNERTLARMHREKGNDEKARAYQVHADARQMACYEVLWDPESQLYADFNVTSGQLEPGFYPSTFAALWGGIHNSSRDAAFLAGLKKTGALDYPGGIPTSFLTSGQQWDFPNCWAPLQWLAVEGLQSIDHPEAGAMAEEVAAKWLRANLAGWQKSGVMYEKYDARVPGEHGGGGEYDGQTGFGWTNGVALAFIARGFTV